MGEPRYHQIISPELTQIGREKLDALGDTRFPNRLLMISGGLALVGMMSLPLVSSEALSSEKQDIAAACSGDPCQSAETNTTTLSSESPIVASVTTTANSVAEPNQPPKEIINPVVSERMLAMNLTPEGYISFLQKLDMSLLSYSQQKAEFNPKTNNKPQHQTKRVLLHYTAQFYNNDGVEQVPRGPSNPRGFIDSISARYGSVLEPGGSSCCAANGFIDRDANSYLLAPIKAKLQHNPPTDVEEFGIEIESANMQGITTQQYEKLAYYTLVVLKNENLIDNPLSETVRGHGEQRKEYLQKNPDKKGILPTKIDFTSLDSDLFRRVLGDFINRNPSIKTVPLPPLPN